MIFYSEVCSLKLDLYNPMTYVFKVHVKIVKIYMVKFNVSILNMPKMMDFLLIQRKYIYIVLFLVKLQSNFSLFWQNVFFFQNLNPTRYLKNTSDKN